MRSIEFGHFSKDKGNGLIGVAIGAISIVSGCTAPASDYIPLTTSGPYSVEDSAVGSLKLLASSGDGLRLYRMTDGNQICYIARDHPSASAPSVSMFCPTTR